MLRITSSSWLFILVISIFLGANVYGQERDPWRRKFEEAQTLNEQINEQLGNCRQDFRVLELRLKACGDYVTNQLLAEVENPREGRPIPPFILNRRVTTSVNGSNSVPGAAAGANAGAGTGTNSGVTAQPAPCDCSEQIAEAADLEQKIRSANRRCEELTQRLRNEMHLQQGRARSSFDSLLNILTGVRDSLLLVNKDLNTARRIVSCMERTQYRIDSFRRAAQPALDSARRRYELYKTDIGFARRSPSRRPELETRINDHITFIYDIYTRYDDRPDTVLCGGIPLTSVIEFTDAQDHLNLANIIVANPRRLVNNDRFGQYTDQAVALMTADLIYHVSKIYTRQTNYSERSNTDRTISRDLLSLFTLLPGALVGSSQVDLSADTSAIDRRYTKSEYAEIAEDFDEGRYAEALGKYNWVSRFEEDEDLRSDTLTRVKVHLAVGTILLFDLGHVSDMQPITLPGTWLRKVLTYSRDVGTLQEWGAGMLSEIAIMNAEDPEIRRLQQTALYRLSKRYRGR